MLCAHQQVPVALACHDRARVKPNLNGRIQHFSWQTYDNFEVRMTTYTANRGWSSKSKPYNKKAAMPN